ncbi:MAG: hypothetical protein OXC98_11970 [bacterium]|nr:hypothetical protein [Acidimicrobiia bacterium]MCY4651069.1 hypothetical protein [bacterium]
MDIVEKAQEAAQSMASAITPTAGMPVTQMVTRNDMAPLADRMVDWAQQLTEQLVAEKLAHADAEAGHKFLDAALKIYNSVAAGMAFKGKEAEHQLAVRRMNDIIDAGIRAHQDIKENARSAPIQPKS